MGSGVLLVLWPPDREKNIFGGLPRGALLEAGMACRVAWGGGHHISRPAPIGWERCSRSSYISLIVYAFGSSLAVSGSDQAYRTISIGQLNALLRLHLRPIDVVVYHGPQGYLVLRGASRLDAFSGYPVRS